MSARARNFHSEANICTRLPSAQLKLQRNVRDNNEDCLSFACLQLEEFARSHDGYANTEHGFTGEDIRSALIPHVDNPASPNAWGMLIGVAVRKGALKATDADRSMKAVNGHRRKTPPSTYFHFNDETFG